MSRRSRRSIATSYNTDAVAVLLSSQHEFYQTFRSATKGLNALSAKSWEMLDKLGSASGDVCVLLVVCNRDERGLQIMLVSHNSHPKDL